MQTSIVCLLRDAQAQNSGPTREVCVAITRFMARAACERKEATHSMGGLTLYDKVWAQHIVKNYDDGDSLIYIDRHLVQEVSSPQAFAGLIAENRAVRRPDAHVAVADHAVPTRFRSNPLPDGLAARQVSRLTDNARRFSNSLYPHGRSSARYRPCHRARTWLHASGLHFGLWRQPYLHARRLWRHRVWHRLE